jgi:glycosyltransferase involved in cell wall biosynthesis
MNFGIDTHGGEREGEGNSTYTRNLCRSLVDLDGDDTFALFAGEPTHSFYRSLGASERFRVRAVAQHRGLGRVLWALARAAAHERVDALHVQYFAPLGYTGPLVLMVHDLGFLDAASCPPSLRLVMRALIPWSVRRATHIVTPSEFTRRHLEARYGVASHRITVTWNGVRENFRPLGETEIRLVLARYGLEPGFLFSLGRLNRRKNLGTMLQAYAELRAQGRADLSLVIGGKVDHGAEEIERSLQDSPRSSRIHRVGLIPDADLPAFYAGAACFVYPSLFEGFGLPLLEAMACGCPVVGSDRAACPEVVGTAGLLVDPEDVMAIAAAIARILDDEALRRDLRDRGLARSRLFTWEESARRTLRVLRDAAGRRIDDSSSRVSR